MGIKNKFIFKEQTFSDSVKLIRKTQSGKIIIIVTAYIPYYGTNLDKIILLNQDGSEDLNFTNNLGIPKNGIIYDVQVQSDGKIVIGGNFTTWNGTTVNRIVRLNSDGTRDTAFTTNTGTAANSDINSIAIQSDGKILVGGYFTSWNGTSVGRIVRLNSDGTRDTAFTTNNGTGANGTIYSIASQSDGKILVGGGDISNWNGTAIRNIVRLNSDGTRDTAFTTNTGVGTNTTGTVYSIATQSDGKIVIGGNFTTWNGTSVGRIVRLNSDGTRDTAFTTNTGTAASDMIRSISIQSDNKIVLGGWLNTWNGIFVSKIVRLNSDGTRDTAFTTNTGTGANGNISSIMVKSNSIFVGGYFTNWNSSSKNYFVVLNSSGQQDLNIWADVSIIYAKVDGTWKVINAVYNKVNGIWKQSFP